MARIFKIRVDDFSVGFGKRLIRIGKLGDTEYNIRMVPLGGFVKIAGMEPDEEPINRAKEAVIKHTTKVDGKESDFSDDLKDDVVEGVDDRSKAMAKSDDPDSHKLPLLAENMDDPNVYCGPDGFNSKPLWQRSLVILGGPVMSFITGVVILCLLGCTFGIPMGKSIARVAQVQPKGEGQRIGLQAGDYIIAMNGIPVHSGEEMVNTIHNSLGKTLVLTIRRSGQVIKLPPAKPRPWMDPKTNKPIIVLKVTNPGALAAMGLKAGDQVATFNGAEVNTVPQFNEFLTRNAGHSFNVVVLRGMDEADIKGIIPTTIAASLPTIDGHEVGILNFNPDSALVHMGFVRSVATGLRFTKSIFIALGDLIKTKQLQSAAGGVVSMANMTSVVRKDGISHVLSMAAQISISLAIFNMLPIPILDGGHLLTFFIEWVRRGKKLTPQWQNAFMMTGLAIIVLLVVLINGKDLWNTIRHNVVQ